MQVHWVSKKIDKSLEITFNGSIDLINFEKELQDLTTFSKIQTLVLPYKLYLRIVLLLKLEIYR